MQENENEQASRAAAESTTVNVEKPKGSVKERVGLATRDAKDKTVPVQVERAVEHPLYKKGIKRTKTFKVHDKNNDCKAGDLVRIQETRPLSKTKRWRMVEIVKRAD